MESENNSHKKYKGETAFSIFSTKNFTFFSNSFNQNNYKTLVL